MDFTPTDVMLINSISLNLSNVMSATYFHEKKQMNFSNFHIAIVPEQKMRTNNEKYSRPMNDGERQKSENKN